MRSATRLREKPPVKSCPLPSLRKTPVILKHAQPWKPQMEEHFNDTGTSRGAFAYISKEQFNQKPVRKTGTGSLRILSSIRNWGELKFYKGTCNLQQKVRP